MAETLAAPKMWDAIYHDTDKDRMFLWYTDGTMDILDTVNTFYTPNINEFGAKPCGMVDIYGREMYRAVAKTKDERRIRQEHDGSRNYISEIDIEPRARFLQKHYENAGMLHPNMSDINICFLDIEVETTGRFPAAHRAEYPINCVTIYFSKTNNYITYGVGRDIRQDIKDEMAKDNCVYVLCQTEQELIRTLFTEIGKNNVSILSGWNFVYDTTYLINRAAKFNIPLALMSRLPTAEKRAWVDKKDGTLKIAGTEVIDFLQLYRKYTFSEEPSYKLDYIGGIICNEHKAPLPDGYLSWKNYWDEFIFYNFKDVKLCKMIDDKVKMFNLAVSAAAEARVPFSFVFESKKMLVGFVLNHLHKTGRVFPPLRVQAKQEFPGAFVYSVPGYYEKLVSYDYRSLYPSIMMTFNTSPELKVVYPIDYVVPEEELKNLIRSPWTNGGKYQVFFRKDKLGVVPEVTRLLFDGRSNLKKLMKKAKKAGDKEMTAIYDMMQKVYKVLGNSLYGLLGSQFFAFYDVDNAASITAYGQRLIKYTIENLAHYINENISTDEKFINTFGYTPVIEDKYLGTTVDEDGQVLYRRMSHGDTDSFFVKFTDIVKPFEARAGKDLEVIVFEKNKEIVRQTYKVDDELTAKRSFNKMCKHFAPKTWADPENFTPDEKTGFTKVQIMFADGIVTEGDYRIIYNRFRLTDFCRILDAVILEDKLDEYMLSYAEKWNYHTNELFLKREKCIYKAIVTAKKKYICQVESMEDIVYLDKGEKLDDGTWRHGTLAVKPEFAITGLEIVRSSTTVFSRERMLKMVSLMLDTMDKDLIRSKLLDMKREFFDAVREGNYSYIACPSGVKKEPPTLYAMTQMEYTNPEEYKKLDWRVRAASVWNYLIESDPVLSKTPYEPIFAGDKMKFIKKADDLYNTTIFCYSGDKCPERLFELFHPDWKEHWRVSVAQILGRLFKAVGWPEELEYDESRNIMALL